MDGWIWAVLVGVSAVVVLAVCRKRRARRVYVIDHVRVEMHPARVVEDRVIEHVWRAAISMTSTSRGPRILPVFAERATVRAGKRDYLARIYLDTAEIEVDPSAIALAWVEFMLPSGWSKLGDVRTVLLKDSLASRQLAFKAAPRENVASESGRRVPLRSGRQPSPNGSRRGWRLKT